MKHLKGLGRGTVILTVLAIYVIVLAFLACGCATIFKDPPPPCEDFAQRKIVPLVQGCKVLGGFYAERLDKGKGVHQLIVFECKRDRIKYIRAYIFVIPEDKEMVASEGLQAGTTDIGMCRDTEQGIDVNVYYRSMKRGEQI